MGAGLLLKRKLDRLEFRFLSETVAQSHGNDLCFLLIHHVCTVLKVFYQEVKEKILSNILGSLQKKIPHTGDIESLDRYG